jgi:hypothetical protein
MGHANPGRRRNGEAKNRLVIINQGARMAKGSNGYVVYPNGVSHMQLGAANKDAKKQSLEYGDSRVENVNTEKIVSRYKWGKKIR